MLFTSERSSFPEPGRVALTPWMFVQYINAKLSGNLNRGPIMEKIRAYLGVPDKPPCLQGDDEDDEDHMDDVPPVPGYVDEGEVEEFPGEEQQCDDEKIVEYLQKLQVQMSGRFAYPHRKIYKIVRMINGL
jgi:hypothetical protein